MQIKTLLMAVLAATIFSVTGCAKEEGPMEKAGKSMDNAAQSVEDTAESVADDVKKAVGDD